MTNVCMYFQVHQPFRLRKYSLFDIGKNSTYFDLKKNSEVLCKVAKKCYLPANALMLDLIAKHEDFKITYSITGTAIEQFQAYAPEVLESFSELARTGAVEFLSETYYHSLSFLYDSSEFATQVRAHAKLMKKEFRVKPTVFRNTELIYNNHLAATVERMGYKGILAEGWDGVLGWRAPNYVYKPFGCKKLKLLLKNYKLSDDLAFRFSDKNWSGWPLTCEKYAEWLAPILGDSINLFMDYETFGEHQWVDTGIFNFLSHLPAALKRHGISFSHPSDVLSLTPKEELDIPHTISWADVERDTSAWLGNAIQNDAAAKLYALRSEVLATKNSELIDTWRKLTTSDHFYYMCTKWFNDGDVHKYFNPHETPYDAFITYMNVLQDFEHKLSQSRPRFFSTIRTYLKEVSA